MLARIEDIKKQAKGLTAKQLADAYYLATRRPACAGWSRDHTLFELGVAVRAKGIRRHAHAADRVTAGLDRGPAEAEAVAAELSFLCVVERALMSVRGA